MLVKNYNKDRTDFLIQKLNQSPQTYAKNRVQQIRKKINSKYKEKNIQFQNKENQSFKNLNEFQNQNTNLKQVIIDSEDKKFQFSLSSLHEIKSIELSKISNPLTNRQQEHSSQLQKLQRKDSEILTQSRNQQSILTARKERIKVLDSINNRIKQALNQRCASRFTNINKNVNQSTNQKHRQIETKKQLFQLQNKELKKQLKGKELFRLKYQQQNKQNCTEKIIENFHNQDQKQLQRQQKKGKYLKTIKKNLINRTQEKIKEEVQQKRNIKQNTEIKQFNRQIIKAHEKSPSIKIDLKQQSQQKSNKKQLSSHKRQYSNFKISENLNQLKEKVQKKQILKLSHVLSTQVQKQSILKQKRWKFINLTCQQKWQKLRKLFPSKSLQALKSEVQIPSQEHDPFFQVQKHIDQKCIEDLAQNLKGNIQNWNRFVKKSIKKEALQRQSFNIKDIDLNSKGFLSVQDLVCFINLYTGQYFRNRDLISLMKRFLQQGEKELKISYENFMKTLCISTS